MANTEQGQEEFSISIGDIAGWVARMFFLTLAGYGMILAAYCVTTLIAIKTFTNDEPLYLKRTPLESNDIMKTVAFEGLRDTLAPVWEGPSWANGALVARVQIKLSMLNKFIIHIAAGALCFALLGFVAGRFRTVNSSLLLPPLLFFATWGLMQSGLFALPLSNPLYVVFVLAVQLLFVYGFALWGKWSAKDY